MHLSHPTRRRGRHVLALGVAVVVLAATAACGSDDGPEGGSGGGSDDPIKVGVIVPLTGPLAGTGQQLLDGYEYGIEKINEDGGIDGRKIELESKDDKFDPTVATTQVKQLIVQDKVEVMLGTVGSANGIAASGVSEQYKVPTLQTSVSDPALHEQGLEYTFNLYPLNSLVEHVADEFIINEVKPATAALLYVNLGWAQAAVKTSVAELEAGGVEVVAQEEIPTGETDYSAAISKLKDAKPDVLKLIVYPGDVSTILQQAKQVGFEPKATYVNGDASVEPSVRSALGDLLEGVLNTTLFYDGQTAFPEALAVADEYVAEGNEFPPPYFMRGYQATQVLKDALERAGSTDADDIKKALAETDLATIFGDVTFDETGAASSPVVVSQYQDGNPVPLWPADLAGGTYRP